MPNFLRFRTYRKFRRFLRWTKVVLSLVLLALNIIKKILDL
ncbi:MAG: hypothetical protein AABY53_10695 [Bdellovibrionota bacterium]